MDCDEPAMACGTESRAAAPTRARTIFLTALRRLGRWAIPALVLGVYGYMAIGQLPTHRYQINPDGASYLSIARQIVHGHFADSISAYWSPLYSWLMVPPMWVGVDPMLAGKITGIGIGGAALAGLLWLMRTLGVRQDIRLILALAVIPFIVDAVYVVTTPDLLVGVALLFYLAAFCRCDLTSRRRAAWSGVMLGAWGGVAFLAKAYALPFVLAHIFIVRAIELVLRRGVRQRLLIHTALALLSMGVIVAAWSAVLTQHVGWFTTGTTGAYNMRIDARGSPGQVMHFAGFISPPARTALSAWTDITPYLDHLPPRHIVQTEADREFLKKQLQVNYDQLVKELDQTSPVLCWLGILILLAGGSRADRRRKPAQQTDAEASSVPMEDARPISRKAENSTDRTAARPMMILALAVLIYPCGYLLLHVESRFLVPLVLMLMAGAGVLIARASTTGLLSGWVRPGALAIALGATLVSSPLKNLERTTDTGKSIAAMADFLRGVIPSGSNIASTGNWGQSLFISFYLDLHYYGEPPRRGNTMEKTLAQLQTSDIRFLLVWNKRSRIPEASGWSRVTLSADAPLHLYQRDVPPTSGD